MLFIFSTSFKSVCLEKLSLKKPLRDEFEKGKFIFEEGPEKSKGLALRSELIFLDTLILLKIK